MKLTFLGTSAPEGNPSPFCDCKNCEYVRKHKGKNIRLGASLLINNDFLIDFGPDVTRECNQLGISMTQIKNILITHCHFDHFYPINLYHRCIGPRTTNLSELHIYGPELIHKLAEDWLKSNKEQKVSLYTIEPYQERTIGNYHIKSLSITQNDIFAGKGMGFIVGDGNKTILYIVDTYILPEENWQLMTGQHLDIVILDETFGFVDPPNKDHHNIYQYLTTIGRLKKEKIVDSDTIFFTQHMSHHNPPHDKLIKIMAKYGVRVPFDKQVISI